MPEHKTPPPPEKPSAHECCASGCVPCIYDYYYDALEKWTEKYGRSDNDRPKISNTESKLKKK